MDNAKTRQHTPSQQALVKRFFTTAASLGVCLLITLSLPAYSQAPLPFHITYDVSYGNLKAEGERSLSSHEENGIRQYHMQSISKATLLGRSLVTITEQSHFGWQENLPLPERYDFQQSGLGKRQRSIEFAQDSSQLSFNNDGNIGTINTSNTNNTNSINTPVYDDLTAFLVIREQLIAGAKDIYFNVMNKDNIKAYHYRVIDNAVLETDIGNFAAVHLERIRGENNERNTELWLAPEHDFILLKMRQEEPGGRLIRLDIKTATVDNVVL